MITEVLKRPGLLRVREAMLERGFDIRIVGGAVRSHLLGVTAADIDLCTNANPDEQIAVYEAAGFRYIATGLQHGTITVVVPEEDHYEITSLRTETDHDGRHATVSYTRDWAGDLARRDLTINAMALTFEGEVIDPFGGQVDLAERRVRFVGDPAERMREDYLRILRWLRFHARIAGHRPLDTEAARAARDCARNLGETISRERVWMEMAKIVVGPAATAMMRAVEDLGLAPFLNLPEGDLAGFEAVTGRDLSPSVMMAAYLRFDVPAIQKLATAWRWSTEELELARFVSQLAPEPVLDYRRLMTMRGMMHGELSAAYRKAIGETARARGEDADTVDFVAAFNPPICPVNGDDLMDLGLKQGPQVGVAFRRLRTLWYDAGCPTSRESTLGLARRAIDEATSKG